MEAVMRFEVGDICRHNNMNAYRAGADFKIVGVSFVPDQLQKYVYIVKYPDGELDCFPVENEGGYEMMKVN